MTTGIIIQARMGAKRFPGKVLAPLCGKPVLAHVVERCKASAVEIVVVATSTQIIDDQIVKWCQANQTSYARGAENNVLSRFVHAANLYKLDHVIRVNADCPLIEPAKINALLPYIEKGLNYVAYAINGQAAITSHVGLPELISTSALQTLLDYSLAIQEHVTAGCYVPNDCSPHYINDATHSIDEQNTIDTPEDLQRIEARCKSNWMVKV